MSEAYRQIGLGDDNIEFKVIGVYVRRYPDGRVELIVSRKDLDLIQMDVSDLFKELE